MYEDLYILFKPGVCVCVCVCVCAFVRVHVRWYVLVCGTGIWFILLQRQACFVQTWQQCGMALSGVIISHTSLTQSLTGDTCKYVCTVSTSVSVSVSTIHQSVTFSPR